MSNLNLKKPEYNYQDCISGNCVNGLGSAQYEPEDEETVL